MDQQTRSYARWALQNGAWVYGTSNEPEYIRKSEQFALTVEHMRKIESPALILEGENDLVFKGQAGKLAAELKAPHKHIVMRNADGAGEHCHKGAMRLHLPTTEVGHRNTGFPLVKRQAAGGDRVGFAGWLKPMRWSPIWTRIGQTRGASGLIPAR
jgi:hypothetical protein